MFWRTLTAGALLGQYASAQNMLRFGCSQLTIERADPLVSPGQNPSPHTHQIIGGNSFNLTMEPVQYDLPSMSTCTTCTYSEDFSNYWTASLYFKSPENGTFQRVPQFANFGIQQDGGMTVYYMPYSAKNGKMTAFKPGFRMIAGDPLNKKNQYKPSICHRCLGNGEGFAPCDAKDSAELPTKYCPGGIRATVIFPSCWDGKNLDSPDHKTHVAYSNGGGLGSPNCPATHPVAIPQVMYEIMWDTGRYKDTTWYGNGKQPFVYSFGDAIGNGQHGDYVFGWKDDSLQKAMDALPTGRCANANCSVLKIQSAADAMKCKKSQQVVEDVGKAGEWLSQLPGGVAVTY
ncbi:hypothetical protein ONZ43_g3615 [Nemania bipapillata]|uniref:Uncharacterized protein n=1 Tax=Nemania bipapillata TaxID=110536 RepID=A0ACC2IWI8_9PEZI|nr:hypothetical protein ONZ43_g3615 [Nemania bipapillata]